MPEAFSLPRQLSTVWSLWSAGPRGRPHLPSYPTRRDSQSIRLRAFKIISAEGNNRGEVTAHPLVIANMLNKGGLSNSYWSNYWKNATISCARGSNLQ